MQAYLTVADVAERLGVSGETVRRWLRSGQLEGALLSRRAGWRIRPDAVERMIADIETSAKKLAA